MLDDTRVYSAKPLKGWFLGQAQAKLPDWSNRACGGRAGALGVGRGCLAARRKAGIACCPSLRPA
jgi:hypothetical protein